MSNTYLNMRMPQSAQRKTTFFVVQLQISHLTVVNDAIEISELSETKKFVALIAI